MELAQGKIAVVTGAGSGIGLALAHRFARSGLSVVLADVQIDALETAAAAVADHGVDTLAVRCDVSKQADVDELATATLQRFGGVDVVCNNAGVAGKGDPWFGPLSSWEWTMGVNFWGVVHGVRTFLPHLVTRGGHIVNTASIAGLLPGFSPAYSASKHAVVAISEELFTMLQTIGIPVGVSCLCPGWVRTGILDSDRNWPDELGARPEVAPQSQITFKHTERAIAEGANPAAVADLVADAVQAGRFWVFPQQEFVDLAVARWHLIAEHHDPVPPEHIPGMPPRSQMIAEMFEALGLPPPSKGPGPEL
jgi:NAD(P)-dependent dehydrogenase (short-subunit alcohol dehydrogenase family)